MSDLRRKILDASISMVAEDGVRAVSFREVARRAGVSHQAPYHHFGNYEGILHAIAEEGFGALADAMQEAADVHTDDPVAALTAAGVAYVLFARDNIGRFRVMFQQKAETAGNPTRPPEQAGRAHATLVKLTGDVVLAGHGGGLPVEVVTGICWSTVHGLASLMVQGALEAKQPLSRAKKEHLARQVVGGLAGLLARPSRSQARSHT